MAQGKFNKHDKIHHELFDEDTNQVGSLGDIVNKHAGDAVFLTEDEDSIGGADAGESDFVAEMLSTDPAENAGLDSADYYDQQDLMDADDMLRSADQTGTVQGIARGFGTHMPQDIGSGGFQVEELPDEALNYKNRILHQDEELDDYDDNNETGKYDSDEDLAYASQPGVNRISDRRTPPTPNTIPVKNQKADDFDDELDATRKIR